MVWTHTTAAAAIIVVQYLGVGRVQYRHSDCDYNIRPTYTFINTKK